MQGDRSVCPSCNATARQLRQQEAARQGSLPLTLLPSNLTTTMKGTRTRLPVGATPARLKDHHERFEMVAASMQVKAAGA